MIALLESDELSDVVGFWQPSTVVLGTEQEDSRKFEEPISILRSLGGNASMLETYSMQVLSF